jgi:hypothetical protein
VVVPATLTTYSHPATSPWVFPEYNVGVLVEASHVPLNTMAPEIEDGICEAVSWPEPSSVAIPSAVPVKICEGSSFGCDIKGSHKCDTYLWRNYFNQLWITGNIGYP